MTDQNFIDNLPAEMISRMSSHLDLAGIVKLSASSHFWRSTMLATLKRGPLNLTDDYGPYHAEHLPHIICLIKLILRFPSIGAAVRRLTINPGVAYSPSQGHIKAWPTYCEFLGEDLDRLEHLAEHNADLNSKVACIDRLLSPLVEEYGPFDRAWDLLAIIAVLCPRIQVLDLSINNAGGEDNGGGGTDGFDRFTICFEHKKHFQELQYLYASADVETILDFIVLPKLQVVYLDNCGTDPEAYGVLSFWPLASGESSQPLSSIVKAYIVRGGYWTCQNAMELLNRTTAPAVSIYGGPRYSGGWPSICSGRQHYTSIISIEHNGTRMTCAVHWPPFEKEPEGGYPDLAKPSDEERVAIIGTKRGCKQFLIHSLLHGLQDHHLTSWISFSNIAMILGLVTFALQLLPWKR